MSEHNYTVIYSTGTNTLLEQCGTNVVRTHQCARNLIHVQATNILHVTTSTILLKVMLDKQKDCGCSTVIDGVLTHVIYTHTMFITWKA